MSTVVYTETHKPHGVIDIVGRSAYFLIGITAQSTAVKYVKAFDMALDVPRKIYHEAQRALAVEASLYQTLGPHPHILGFLGQDDVGVHLEYAVNGSLGEYLSQHPASSVRLRLQWCEQVATAVTHCHQHRVIHCDVHPRNILLDENLVAKLADFQGQLRSSDGTTILDGNSCEGSQYGMPGATEACELTDIFALGSTIYHALTGHEPFPELVDGRDDDEIARRWTARQYPAEVSHGWDIIQRCWEGRYSVASKVAEDLRVAQDQVHSHAEV